MAPFIDQDLDSFDSDNELPATQEDSQPPPSQPEPEPHLWGFLQHVTGSMTRIDLWKITPEYNIGRHTGSTIVFSGLKISSQHCTLSWNGEECDGSAVVVRDYSSNGTYINGKKVGKGQNCILRDGNEIAFGTWVPQIGSKEDYRFIFRQLANEKPSQSVDAFYDVFQQIGFGAYGVVLKALCRETNEWYAIKRISYRRNNLLSENQVQQEGGASEMPTEDTPWIQASLAREIANMQQLKHPNICQLKEVFYEGTGLNLVLEYAYGGDLLNYILNNNGLCEADAQHITNQICSAIHYMHEKGIAHRDLKPENILLTDHTPPIVKIADFGTSKAVGGTMLRTVCGSPQYIAPEIFNGKGYNYLVDSWSVGVIVFSMLTNASPFIEGGTYRPGLTNQMLDERAIDWSILRNTDVSDQGMEFVHRLLQHDPRNRMSMGQALNHPWLREYSPVYSTDNSEVDEPMVSSPSPRKKRAKSRAVDLEAKRKTRGAISKEVTITPGYRVLRSRKVKLD